MFIWVVAYAKQDTMKVLDVEVERFRSKTKRSGEIFNEASRHTPFGVHSNYRYTEPYPLYIKRARGARMWDVDGNEYLDFNMAFGALVAGHSHPVLAEAMRERMENGTIFGFEGEEMPPLARHLCERFKADRVKISMTGLDATLFSVRLARAFTSRKKVLKFEGCYHGSHDVLMVSVKPPRAKAGHARAPTPVPASQGLLPEIMNNTVVAPFNDLASTEELVKKHGQDLAAIILEPIPMNMGFVLPKKGFLEGLRKLADEYNLVLIFDEIKTCGKFYGGAYEAFGVRPDICVLGKAIGGGYAIAAVAGKKEIFDCVIPGVVAHAGTFNSNPVSITAALVTLTKILTPHAMKQAANLGNELGKGYEEIIEDVGLAVRLQYMGISGTMHFTKEPVYDWRSFQKVNVSKWYAYWVAMLNRGIIPMATGPDEQWTMSVLHTKEDVEKHLDAFKEVATQIKTVEAEMPIVEAI